MDKPKINLKAWVPIEKRKNKTIHEATQKRRNQFYASNGPELVIHPTMKEEKKIPYSQKPDNQRNNKEAVNHYLEEDNFKKEDFKHDSMNRNEPMYGPIYVEPERGEKYNKRWYNIEIDERLEKKPKQKKGSINKSKSPINYNIIKTIAAGIGAIATGLVFGYVLLNYFVNPIFHTEETSNNMTPQPPAISLNNNSGGLAINTDTKVIPSQPIYLLQAGVFSENIGAESVHAEQRNMGKAAVISGQGPYYVFIGFSTDRESGNRLKSLLMEEGNDLYLKEYIIPEYKSNMSRESFSTFSKWIIVGEELIQSLSKETIDALINPQHTLHYDEIQKLHQAYLIEAQGMKSALDKENLSQVETSTQRMMEQINYAITALNAYKKSPNPQYLWNIQELLIKYKMNYEELTKS